MASMTSTIVISLDFEQRWGSQHRLGSDFGSGRREFEGVRDAVPALLELFTSNSVRATWALVGALACSGWDEWAARTPTWPAYDDPLMGWNSTTRAIAPADALYFVPDLVELIRATPGQDLGSHSFNHTSMLEPGFARGDAVADAAAMNVLFSDKWNAQPRTFVFPRNQVAFVDVITAAGIEVWRDNPAPFFWRANTTAARSSLVRGLRLLDGLLPLGTRATPTAAASHFVRFNLPTPLWALHLRRLASEARQLPAGHHLHLWWHPHNLGSDVHRGLKRASELLDALGELDVRFASMADLIH